MHPYQTWQANKYFNAEFYTKQPRNITCVDPCTLIRWENLTVTVARAQLKRTFNLKKPKGSEGKSPKRSGSKTSTMISRKNLHP